LAFIAAGQSDIYQHSGIHCWDIAAGAVIVHEAGGVVLDPSGKDFDFMSRGILVASTSELVKEWRAKIDFKRDTFPRDFPDVCPM
jgi:myo-inositol-1(or 4)-monophosphatase